MSVVEIPAKIRAIQDDTYHILKNVCDMLSRGSLLVEKRRMTLFSPTKHALMKFSLQRFWTVCSFVVMTLLA